MTETRLREDLANQYDWDTILEYWYCPTPNEEYLTQRETTYDDGTVRIDSWDPSGVPTNLYLHDGGFNEEWDTIITQYDPNGDILTRETGYDDGGLKREDYAFGVITYMMQRDGNDGPEPFGSHDWHSIDTYYDPLGQISERATFYDDGSFKQEYFSDGVRSYETRFDNSSTNNWQQIDIIYDPLGQVQERFTEYDDLTILIEQFEQGIRRRSEHLDMDDGSNGGGVKNWSRIETNYSEDGSLMDRVTEYDSGIIKFDEYDGGTLRQSTRIDSIDAQTAPAGIEAWGRIETHFDPDGSIDFRVTDFDNGVLRFEEFEDGVRRQSASSDGIANGLPGSNGWESSIVFYDTSGVREASLITYDDGDETATFYENGQVASRHYIDGDEDKPWLARVIRYAPDGSVQSDETFDDFASTPSDFFDLPDQPLF